MNPLYIKKITIEKVRHLQNIQIPVSDDRLKHLIVTGKNGSGKTSLLDALAYYISAITMFRNPAKVINGLDVTLTVPIEEIRERYEAGKFVVAYYKANRVFKTTIPKQVEKVELQTSYAIGTEPRQNLVKYLLDMKMTQALALSSGKKEKAQTIQIWFDKFEELIQRILGNPEIKLVFDEDTFLFSIEEPGKEPYDFNTLSSGYEAIFDIIIDIMMRMEKQVNKTFLYDLPGIVLIDEIETHLHLELQKNIMKMLTVIFPNIQFIVTTHSPFVLNSIDNTTIFDLENKQLVTGGLTDVPYSGVVRGYFGTSELSDELRVKFEAYKSLVLKQDLTDDDFENITELEMYLDEIPDYLALEIATEYKRLKLEFNNREDI